MEAALRRFAPPSPVALRRLVSLRARVAPAGAPRARGFAGSAPHLVPCSAPDRDGGVVSSSGERILSWMRRKAALRQDVFLLGPPGPELRRLALRFCELAGRECELVSLTRDTSEPELKQRREIVRGTMRFVDQPAVRAALHGRVLVLEGVEKAERNMLPLLNNLLENREMALEDGRLLLSPARYDALIADGASVAELDARGLVRVHPDFLVVAIGLPVSRFGGTPLDPPLRSRFQAATLRSLPLDERVALLERAADGASELSDAVRRVADCADALRLLASLEAQAGGSGGQRGWGGVPWLPEASLAPLARTLAALGQAGAPPAALVHRALPWTLLPPAAEAAAAGAVRRCVLGGGGGVVASEDALPLPTTSPLRLAAIRASVRADGGPAVLLEWADGAAPPLDGVPIGALRPPLGAWSGAHAGELRLDAHEAALADVLQAHAVGSDVCVVGAKGCGKTRVVRAAARALGLEAATLHCYRDMTVRDLLQRRSTNSAGDTVWDDSPLIAAARFGWLAVLDGIHRLPPALLAAALGQLLSDRRVELPDGSRLVSHAEWAALVARGHTAAELHAARVTRVHPAFRVIATAEPPSAASPWLSAELLPNFQFVRVRATEPRELVAAFGAAVDARAAAEDDEGAAARGAKRGALARLGALADSLWLGLSHEPQVRSALLSVRALCRLGASALARPEGLDGAVWRLLAPRLRAMPAGAREAVHELMGAAGVLPVGPAHEVDGAAAAGGAPSAGAGSELWAPAEAAVCADERADELVRYDADGYLHIASVRSAHPVPAAAARPELVPQIDFHTSRRHAAALREMLADDNARLPLLLLGDQGVGKNKLCDKFISLLRREREYTQLHRDTTLAALTQSPTIEDGVIKYIDTPLVRAATLGRTLVVDEADKAPLEVVCVLRALVEDGDVMLADGRILSRDAERARMSAEPLDAADARQPAARTVVPIHPDFRVIVLANRPGHPFLGNDLFRECGDVFATHVIDSPDAAGEAALLASIAPRAPRAMLRRVAGLFAELRAHVAEGLLAYPYSTREAVSIARHLEAYPHDGLVGAVDNVFAFDAHEPALAAQLATILRRHGVPVGALAAYAHAYRDVTAERVPLPPLEPEELWQLGEPDARADAEPRTPARRAPRAPVLCKLVRVPLDDVRRYRLAPPPALPLSDAEPRPGRLETFCEARMRVQLARRADGKPAEVVGVAASADGRVHALLHDLTLISLDPHHGRRTELELGSTFLHAAAGAARGAIVRPLPARCALATADADGGADGGATRASGADHDGGGDGGLLVFAPSAGLLLALTRSSAPNPAQQQQQQQQQQHAGFDVVTSIRLPDALRTGAGAAAAGYAAALFAGLGSRRPSNSSVMRAGAPRVASGAQHGSHWAAWLPSVESAGGVTTHLSIVDAGCSEALTVSLAPLPREPREHAPSGAHAGGADARGELDAAAALDARGGSWLLEWANGELSVLLLRAPDGSLCAARAERAEHWPLRRTPVGERALEPPARLELRSSAFGSAVGTQGAAGATHGADSAANSARLVRAPSHDDRSDGATPTRAARLFSLLEAARLVASDGPAGARGELGGGQGALARAEPALLLGAHAPLPRIAAHAEPAATAAALAALDAADAAQLDAAAPSAWRSGRGRVGRLLTHLPSSDALVFAAEDAGSVMHVLSARDWAILALRGAGVADLPPAADAGGTAGGTAGARPRAPPLPPVVAAAPLPARAPGGGGAEGLVSAHSDGSLVLWDVDAALVDAAAREWRQVVGLPEDDGRPAGAGGGRGRRAKGDSDGGELGGAVAVHASRNALPTSMPKKGEVDPQGNPHVGGNRWAGGTGGRDTAGLGGRGGPHRLEGGGDIYQLSDELKAQVSPEALAAAKEIAAAAHADRLRDIAMSPFEAAAYARIVQPVRREIRQLRGVLEGHEARERARVWRGGQSAGELDDARLVDGLAGESTIYRLRADAPPDSSGAPQLKPKVLRFVLDLSGSMYYFNRYDGRLDRQMQTAAMVFEALAGFEHKYQYAVVAHSGDGPCEPFVEYGAPPRDDKERLQLLQRMAAHTQYCQSGDTTLNAAKAAVADVLTRDADERFVFLLSDANLARYDIDPHDLRAALCSSERVEAHALFISSMRDEAEQIRRALPAGRGHVCLSASDVPRTFKAILHARALGNL